jgi:hypothetical protein
VANKEVYLLIQGYEQSNQQQDQINIELDEVTAEEFILT